MTRINVFARHRAIVKSRALPLLNLQKEETTMKRISLRLLVLAVALLLMPIPLGANGPDACNHYQDTSPLTVSGYGGYCGGWGYGCPECYGTNSNGTYWWCVTDGNWCATGGSCG